MHDPSIFRTPRLGVAGLALLFATAPAPAHADPLPVPPAMVILTPDNQTAAWQRLAGFKTRIGVPTSVISLSYIFANYSGADSAATIRVFLQSAHASGAEFALLAGYVPQIPIRRARTLFFGGAWLPTDLYYSDLDRDWDGDGDGIYGEGFGSSQVPGDQVDLYPDIYVGRIPSCTPAEAEGIVDKLLAYSQAPPSGLATTALLIAEPGGAGIAEDHRAALTGFSVTRLYADDQSYPGSLPATRQSVLDHLDTGYGLMYQLGYAPSEDRFYVNGETVTAADIAFLSNQPRIGFLLSTTEYTCDVTHNCVGGAFVRNPNGGGVGLFGSTHFNFVSTSRLYETEFLRQIFDLGEARAGVAAAVAKVPFVPLSASDNTHRWAQMTLNLLGDPEQWIWTREPKLLEIAHNGLIPEGATEYVVTVTADGAPVDSARVALWKPEDIYEVGWTDAAGNVTFSFPPASAGPFTAGAWAPDHIPVVAGGNVTSAVAPFQPPTGLRQNSPNPFHDRTSIVFTLSRTDDLERPASLVVFDVQGRPVRNLFRCSGCSGIRTIQWDGRDDRGALLPAGVYRYRLSVGGETSSRRLVITR